MLCAKSSQSCLTLHDRTDCSPPGSSVLGILQARILGWVAMSSSRGPRNWTLFSCLLHWQEGFFFFFFLTSSAIWEAHITHLGLIYLIIENLYLLTTFIYFINLFLNLTVLLAPHSPQQSGWDIFILVVSTLSLPRGQETSSGRSYVKTESRQSILVSKPAMYTTTTLPGFFCLFFLNCRLLFCIP